MRYENTVLASAESQSSLAVALDASSTAHGIVRDPEGVAVRSVRVVQGLAYRSRGNDPGSWIQVLSWDWHECLLAPDVPFTACSVQQTSSKHPCSCSEYSTFSSTVSFWIA